ncbi:unnamed protein product [Closterium sp. NIES-53]
MIALCREHRLEHRTKHIALRYFLARELQQRGQLCPAYMATRANTADIFTKALPHGDHQRFSTVLGLLALLYLTGLVTTCGRPGKPRQSGDGGSSGWKPTNDADKKKSANDSGRGGGSRLRECWLCDDPDHLSFECLDRSDSDDDDAKGGRGRCGSRRPDRGRNQPCKEKQSTKSSTSAKDADSSAGGKGRDDKEASCSLVGVVEPTILLAPESGENFLAMAAAVLANTAVILLDCGCSHHSMWTKEVFLDLHPSGDVKHVRGFNGTMQNLKENGVKLHEDGDGMLLVLAAGDVLGRASYTGRILCIDLRPCSAKSATPTMEVVALRAVVSVATGLDLKSASGADFLCVSCVGGKLVQHKFPDQGSDADDVLAFVHIDLCGPFRVAAKDGSLYFLLLKDCKTHYMWHHWWHLALRQAIWVRNCLERSTLQPGTMPYQLLTGKKPDLSLARNVSLEVWKSEHGPGSGRTPTTPPTDTSTATLALLAEVGEPAAEDVEDLSSPSPSPAPPVPPLVADLLRLTPASTSGDEGSSGASPKVPTKSIAGGRRDVLQVDMRQDAEGSDDSDNGEEAEESTDSDVVEVQGGPRRTGRLRRPPDFFVPAAFTTVYDVDADDLEYDDVEDDEELPELDPDMYADPEHRWDISTMTVKEALASWKGNAVKAAMEEEICSVVGMGTWELVERPPGVNIMKNRWVLTMKYHIDDTVECEKARLVVKGFMQVYGTDYDETYAPVSSYVMLRIFLSIFAVLDLNLMQLDMKNAFLQSKLVRVLYMHQPDYFNDGTGRVCKLLKSLYGLKQSPLLWYRPLDEFRQLDARTPTVLRVDNKSAITVAEGMGLTGNLKHMEQRQAWLQHMVKHGKLSLRYIPTAEQPADFLTKALHYPTFNRCSVAISQVRLVDVGDGDNDVQ